MGPVFYQKILKHGSVFLTEPKFSGFCMAKTPNENCKILEKWAYFSRKILKNGYPFLPRSPIKIGRGFEAQAAHPCPTQIWVRATPPPPPTPRAVHVLKGQMSWHVILILKLYWFQKGAIEVDYAVTVTFSSCKQTLTLRTQTTWNIIYLHRTESHWIQSLSLDVI